MVALFPIVKVNPNIHQQIYRETGYTSHTMKNGSAIRRNELLTNATMWIHLTTVMLTQTPNRKEHILYNTTYRIF